MITVDRVDGSSGAVTVHYATSDATPGAQSEYVPTSGTLLFQDGVTVETFTIQLIATTQFEVDQAVNLTLSNPTGGAVLGSPSTSVLVIHNSNAPEFGGFQFSSTVYAAAGGTGSALITVTRIGGDEGLATVNFATGGGTAVAGLDYTPESGDAHLPSRRSPRRSRCPSSTRSASSATRTIGLALSNPTGGATLGFPSSATIRRSSTPCALAAIQPCSAHQEPPWVDPGPQRHLQRAAQPTNGRQPAELRLQRADRGP